MTTISNRNWTPVRRGPIYCSPACGGKCKWAQYEHRVAQGKALVAHLGKGWTYEVHENLGWFVKAVSPDGRLKVHGAYHTGEAPYAAYLSEKGEVGGVFSADGNTPMEAITAVVTKGKAAVARAVALVEGL